MPRKHLTYANVVSTLALAAALTTSGAYAAATIGSANIKRNAITSKHIAPGTINGTDIAPDAITTRHTAPQQVFGGYDIYPDSIDGRDIAPSAIDCDDLAFRVRMALGSACP